MVARVSTVAFEGIEARAVDVQVQVAPGLPAFAIVRTIKQIVGTIGRYSWSMMARIYCPLYGGCCLRGSPRSGATGDVFPPPGSARRLGLARPVSTVAWEPSRSLPRAELGPPDRKARVW